MADNRPTMATPIISSTRVKAGLAKVVLLWIPSIMSNLRLGLRLDIEHDWGGNYSIKPRTNREIHSYPTISPAWLK